MRNTLSRGELVLLAYVDGTDLESVQDLLHARFKKFITSWGSRFADVWTVSYETDREFIVGYHDPIRRPHEDIASVSASSANAAMLKSFLAGLLGKRRSNA